MTGPQKHTLNTVHLRRYSPGCLGFCFLQVRTPFFPTHLSGQIIATSAEVTPNGGLVSFGPAPEGWGGFIAMAEVSGRLTLEPDLANLEDDSMVDLVMRVQTKFPGCAYGTAIIHRQAIFTDCVIPNGSDKCTLFRVRKVCIKGQIWILHTDQTTVCKHSPHTERSVKQILEMCAGIGAVDVGYEHCGASVSATNDQNIRFCQLLHARGRSVVAGDIALPSTVARMAQHAGNTISAGVSCQPFSSLGDQLEEKDSRVMSLVGVLHAIHLLQAPLGILECTKAAFTSQWFQSMLKQFCEQTGKVLQQSILELHECWPSKRTRWWGTVSAPELKVQPIPSLPKTTFAPSLRHLFPKPKPMGHEEIEALMLDLYELRNFHECPKGIQQNTIQWDKPLPTAVHSWGSQLKQCACGCRSTGFSADRLSTKGLYGQLVPMEGSQTWMQHEIQNMRHMHPQEVALACGLLPSHAKSASDQLKLMLAGVGQLASPLQSVWVYANALKDIQISHGQFSVDPIELFVSYGKMLFQERNELLECSSDTNRYMELFEKAWMDLGSPKPVEVEDRKSNGNPLHETPCSTSDSTISLAIRPPNPKIVPLPKEILDKDMIHQLRVGSEPACQMQPDVSDQALLTVVRKAEKRARDTCEFQTGGVPGFAVKKSKIPEQPENPIVKIFPDEISMHKVHPEEPVVMHEVGHGEDSDNKEVIHATPDDSKSIIPVESTFTIQVMMSDTSPIEYVIPSNCVAAQIAKAEEKLETVKQPIAIADMMGCLIPPNASLSPNQKIRVQEGGLNPGKCPREGESNQPVLVNSNRLQLLWQQEGWVEWNEMKYYASMVDKVNPNSVVEGVVIPDDPSGPLQLSKHIWNMIQWGVQHNQPRVASYFLRNDHWTPICVEIGATTVVYTTPMQITWIRECCQTAWGHTDIQFADQPIAAAFPADCGFQTIGWINAMILSETTMIPVGPGVACQWRQLFSEYLEQTGQAHQVIKQPLILGGMQSIQEELQQFVEAHGVASQRSQSCAKELIEALGLSSIQNILRSPKPWADLKARASLHRPPIRVVLASELSESIKQRKSEGVVGSKASKSKKSFAPQEPLVLQANQLEIPHAVFKQSDDIELGQLQPHQIGAGCQGVLLVNIQDALPYFALSSPVTNEGAALLIVDHADSRIPTNREIIRVPAQCKATNEPVILTVAMLQLGQKTVMRNTPSQWVAIKEVDNKVIRVLQFRDQFQGQWQDIADKPVKSIMALKPFASLAPHNILDVWDRQFTTLRMSKTTPAEAEVFLVNLRVTSDVIPILMGASGNEGLFVEPRSHNGRQPDSEHQIVWLPKKTFAEAVIARQTTTVSTVLARSGDKYGLRVRMDDAEQVHTLHRPDLMFMQGGELKKFRVGPLPYGSTKQSIVNAFQKWGWQARPITPCGQSQDQSGVMWYVQASEPPAYWIFQMQHGDVLVTPETSAGSVAANHPGGIIASSKTIQCLRVPKGANQSKQESQEDPWKHYDPWQSSAKEVSVGQVLSLQNQLEATIDKKIADMGNARMEDDSSDRINQLEQQMQQMSASVQSFQQQQVQHTQNLYGQVQTLDKRLNDQHQSINTMLDSKLEDQMQKIEMLLTKRSRTE